MGHYCLKCKGYSLNWSICALMWSSHTVLSCLYSLADILWEQRFSTAWGDRGGKVSSAGRANKQPASRSEPIPGRAPLDCTWWKCCSEWPPQLLSASARSPVCSFLVTWVFLQEKHNTECRQDSGAKFIRSNGLSFSKNADFM